MTQAPDRPSLARKVTPKDEARREDALNEGVKLTLDGEEFILRRGEVTPEIARAVRQVTGRSFNRLLETLGDDPDIDVIAEAVWVARLCRGERVGLDDVAVSYGLIASGDFDITLAGTPIASEVDDSPEA